MRNIIILIAKNLFLICIAISSIRAEWKTAFTLKSSFGVYSGLKNESFTDTLDQFIGNWYALRIDHETALSYENVPDLLEFIVSSRVDSTWHLYYHFNMRRDIEAWYQDNLGNNLFTLDNDFDINIPFHFFLRYSVEPVSFKVGRFPQKFGFSPTRGVAISGSPWYDAIKSSIVLGPVSYQDFFASLNPYLTGAPGSPGYYLSNTEWAIQSTAPLATQRYRVYNEMSKSLIVQRLNIQYKSFQFAAMESMVLGGKYPTLRDVNPFMMWHNLFQNGYVNEIISLECKYNFSPQFNIYSEIAFDDLIGGTEDKYTSSNIYAVLAGGQFYHAFKGSETTFGIEWISTDDNYGTYDLPLLNWTSRQVYRSNFRQKGTPDFSDMYIIDYPIGYFRGNGSNDIWINFNWENQKLSINSSFGFLNKKYSNENDSLLIEDEEVRFEYRFNYIISTIFQLNAGGYYRNIPDHSTLLFPFDNWGISLGTNAKLDW